MRARWIVDGSDAYASDWVHDPANQVTIEQEASSVEARYVGLVFPVTEAVVDTGVAFLTLASGTKIEVSQDSIEFV